jgi:hypothetical protein
MFSVLTAVPSLSSFPSVQELLNTTCSAVFEGRGLDRGSRPYPLRVEVNDGAGLELQQRLNRFRDGLANRGTLGGEILFGCVARARTASRQNHQAQVGQVELLVVPAQRVQRPILRRSDLGDPQVPADVGARDVARQTVGAGPTRGQASGSGGCSAPVGGALDEG